MNPVTIFNRIHATMIKVPMAVVKKNRFSNKYPPPPPPVPAERDTILMKVSLFWFCIRRLDESVLNSQTRLKIQPKKHVIFIPVLKTLSFSIVLLFIHTINVTILYIFVILNMYISGYTFYSCIIEYSRMNGAVSHGL